MDDPQLCAYMGRGNAAHLSATRANCAIRFYRSVSGNCVVMLGAESISRRVDYFENENSKTAINMKLRCLTTLISLIIYASPMAHGQADIEGCRNSFLKSFSSISANDTIKQHFASLLSELRTCMIGKKMPNFKVTTLNGEVLTLSDLQGKIVLVNFWFIGCPPCIEELPMLIALAEKYKTQDFVLLSFSTDSPEDLKKFVNKKGINYTVIPKSRDLIEGYFQMGFGYPTNIFLDRDGNIIDFKLGGERDDQKFAKMKANFINIIEDALKK